MLRQGRGANGTQTVTLSMYLSRSPRDLPLFPLASSAIRYPFDIPGVTAIPKWAFVNVTVRNHYTSVQDCT